MSKAAKRRHFERECGIIKNEFFKNADNFVQVSTNVAIVRTLTIDFTDVLAQVQGDVDDCELVPVIELLQIETQWQDNTNYTVVNGDWRAQAVYQPGDSLAMQDLSTYMINLQGPCPVYTRDDVLAIHTIGSLSAGALTGLAIAPLDNAYQTNTTDLRDGDGNGLIITTPKVNGLFQMWTTDSFTTLYATFGVYYKIALINLREYLASTQGGRGFI
jgi:hypothetical protein